MNKFICSAVICTALLLSGCSGSRSNTQTTPPTQNGTSNTGTSGGNNTTNTNAKTFTLDQLKQFNGQKGNPAYVAVNGVVYDVTNSRDWLDGMHKQCKGAAAGTDMSELINSSPHGQKIMQRMPVVGKLQQ